MVFSHLFSDSTTERPSYVSLPTSSRVESSPQQRCLSVPRLALVSQFQLTPCLQPFSLANQLDNAKGLSVKFHHEDCVQLS